MRRQLLGLTAAVWVAIAVASQRGHIGAAAFQPRSQATPASVSPQRELLDRYCVTCHNQQLKTAGLALDSIDVTKVGAEPEIWEKVVRKLRAGEMPPAGRP